MDEVKISKDDLLVIKDLHRNIIDEGKLGNDLLLLLYDGVESLKNNLFFASIGVFSVFLEKYLRDILITHEYRNTVGEEDDEKFMEFLENTERRIEDDKESKRYYGFNEICDKLITYKQLNVETANELKLLYEDVRIPALHGLYSRIIRKNIGDISVPVTKISINPEGTAEEFIKALTEGIKGFPNTKISLHNPITRMLVLPEYFKNESLKFLFIINKLINITKS